MRTLLPGAVVAGYRIERKLGTGGMGSVYLAQHPRLPRRDALKVLSDTHGSSSEFRARFIREAELAGRLDHPNIVAIYDCGADAGRLWIAMQFIDGLDAAELARQGALTPDRAVAIVEGAARGLDEAHRAGLLHRDVKPANILIARDSGVDRALVTDFGIARPTGESAGLTAAGSVLATLAYAAPEQIHGATLDHRVDVYALGATLFQLLTGTVPFPRDTPGAVMHAHLTAPPPRPSIVVPTLPRELDAVIARAMAKNPYERYPGCGALAEAAAAALRGERTEPVPPPLLGRRTKIIVAAGATLCALAATGFFVTRPDTGSGLAATTTAPPSASVSAPAPASPWGQYGFIADAFPGLLPATPASRGYQNLRCNASDSSNQIVPLDVTVAEPGLFCSGDGIPISSVLVKCNADRSMLPRLQSFSGDEGEETWSRPSGTGSAVWSSKANSEGSPKGVLEVRFDGSARGFCKVRIFGASSGRELHDQWWPNAPI
ncbi:serine/threonine-protein kinase [Nocardia sp. NBC_00403]|uniref:serine/threonine-protein kinase n=1 Tax=Nocardia sp. NBC_00403 TaxID=2975990 RepID=UPI002E1BB99D